MVREGSCRTSRLEGAGRAGERVADDPDHPTVFSVAKKFVC